MAMAWVYGFGSFIFFKVTTAIFMAEGMNLMLAALAGLGMFAAAFCLSRYAAVSLGKHTARSLGGPVSGGEVFVDLLVPTLAAWGALCLWVYIVSLGFDEAFSDNLSGYWATREKMRGALILAVPVGIYAALSYWIVMGGVRDAQRRRGVKPQ